MQQPQTRQSPRSRKKRQNVHPAPFCHCGRNSTARKALGRDIRAATGVADVDPSVAPPKRILPSYPNGILKERIGLRRIREVFPGICQSRRGPRAVSERPNETVAIEREPAARREEPHSTQSSVRMLKTCKEDNAMRKHTRDVKRSNHSLPNRPPIAPACADSHSCSPRRIVCSTTARHKPTVCESTPRRHRLPQNTPDAHQRIIIEQSTSSSTPLCAVTGFCQATFFRDDVLLKNALQCQHTFAPRKTKSM